MSSTFGVFVGIDWASRQHVVCALRPDGSLVGRRPVDHSGEGLGALVAWLQKLSGEKLHEVAVAIEMPHGAVVETLLERGCAVFSINPKQLDRFRDRFSPSGAKDDHRDARVLADSLRTDPHCFRRLKIEEALIVELRECSRIHDEIVEETIREANRFRDQLQRYFPQHLELASDDLSRPWTLELWERLPTPADTKCVRASTIEKILKRHHIRRVDAATVLKTLRQKPLTVALGVETAAVAHIKLIVARLKVLNHQSQGCTQSLKALLQKHGEPLRANESKENAKEDAKEEKTQRSQREILDSLPGVGVIVLATLLGEAPDALRRADYHALRTLSGVAPITKQSGKARTVQLRRACNTRLRTACYHWARTSVQSDEFARRFYERARRRGLRCARTLRSLADRLLAIACSMLRHGTLYDPKRALREVPPAGSPGRATLAPTEVTP